jgi:hypothetical protein
MAQYLADLLGGWMGWSSPTDNRTEYRIPGRPEAGALGSTGTVRGKPKTNLLDPDPTFYDDAGAYGGRTVADLRMGGSALGGVGQPYRNTIPRGMAQLAGVGAPLQAREPPLGGPGVPPPMSRPLIQPQPATPGGPMPSLESQQALAPHPMGPDVPMAAPGMPAPRRLPSAGQPMQQMGGAPQPMAPSGAPPDMLGRDGATDLLGRVKGWLNAEAFPAGQGMSRGMVLAQALANFGAGLSQTGRVGTGLEMANKGMWAAREGEQQRVGTDYDREMKRLGLELKRRELEQGTTPRVFGDKASGYYTMGPDGQPRQVVQPGEAAVKSPTSIEAALLHPDPEIRARAEELRDRAAAIKGTPTPFQQEEHALKLAKLKADIAKANRPGGTGTPPAPPDIQKLIEYRNSLTPGSEEWKLADQYLRRKAASGGSGGSVEAPAPEGYLPLSTTARTAAEKELMTLENSIGKFESFEQTFDPALQTARSSAGGAVAGLLEWAGVPLDEARQQQLESVTGQRAALGEIAGIIRNDLFGAGLTGPEMKSAETFIPKPGDSATQIKTKMTNLKRIAEDARFRKQELLDKGIKKRDRAAPTATPAPVTTPVAPAAQAAAPAPAAPDLPPLAPNQSPREYARSLIRDFSLSEEEAAAKAREEIARLGGG